jgi:hypothetical protein
MENDGHLLARNAESERVRAVVLADPYELLARLHALEARLLRRKDVLQCDVDALGPTDGVRAEQVSGYEKEDLCDEHAGLHLESGLVHVLGDLELPHHRSVRDLR